MRVSVIVFLSTAGAIALCIAIACSGGAGRKKKGSAEQQVVEEKPASVASASTPPRTPEMAWAHPSKAVILGDMRIQIQKSAIGKVALREILGGETPSEEPYFVVFVHLQNQNPRRKLEYKSWANLLNIDRSVLGLERSGVILSDNFGNNYKRANLGLGSFPVGAVENEASIYPGKAITDVLVFEPPIDGATHLDLSLPAKNYGGDGTIRYRIPLSTVTRGK